MLLLYYTTWSPWFCTENMYNYHILKNQITFVSHTTQITYILLNCKHSNLYSLDIIYSSIWIHNWNIGFAESNKVLSYNANNANNTLILHFIQYNQYTFSQFFYVCVFKVQCPYSYSKAQYFRSDFFLELRLVFVCFHFVHCPFQHAFELRFWWQKPGAKHFEMRDQKRSIWKNCH